MNIDTTKNCICNNNIPFKNCCEKFLKNQESAKTALELMRSRYSAYVLNNGNYIYETCSKKLQAGINIDEINRQKIQWLKLKIHSFNKNEVIFTAYFKDNNTIESIKEHSYFSIEDGRLKYDRGIILKSKIERNEPCPCGSGKKYKRCCYP